MNKQIIYSLLPLLASLSMPVTAADGKIYTASQCQAYDYASNLAFRFKDHKATNRTISTRRLVCPITIDASYRNSTAKDSLYNIKVWAIDNNYREEDPRIKCGIYSNYNSGIAVETAWALSKSGADSNVQVLTIPAVDTKTYGSVSLYCYVPGYDNMRSGEDRYSSLVAYRVTEKY